MEERWSPLLPPDDPKTAPREYAVRTKIWRWKGGSWHFANVPAKQSALIKRRFGSSARGWGSIRVRLKIGDTEWTTSLFPAKKTKTYLFMIKASVRKAEDVGAGDTVKVLIHIV